MSLDRVVRAAIHPAIGIARVGDSPDEYFIGPELPYSHPTPEGGFKDSQGRLKRQAAQFRIYGYNDRGRVVRELNLDNPAIEIEWKVEIANTKSAWYNFELALDIPEAVPVARRNPTVKGSDRDKLKITPAPATLSGKNRCHEFDDGKFFDKQVYLGEAKTDELGRLLFLGGRGSSASIGGYPAYTFANNDGWHDDISDGPIRARVKLDGREIPVDSAWVVTAPPNYAPDLLGAVTLYDVITEAAIQGGWLPPLDKSKKVSFTKDVLPIFWRYNRLQWVNKGIFTQFGFSGPQDFLTPEMLRRLSYISKDDPYQELRRQIFNSFRNPDFSDRQVLALPWLYGDGMNVPADNNRQWLALPPHVYEILKLWANGQFKDDLPDRYKENGLASETLPPWAEYDSFEQVPIRRQPDTLDRAALEYCLADAFHPGCEVTWPVRHASMYGGAFRILPRAPQETEPDYGDELHPNQVFDSSSDSDPTAIYGSGVPGGPLYAQGPGDISRWMAVPWQTDTASCRDGYIDSYDEYVPTFWPARVPNQVLTAEDYETVVNTRKSPEDRQLAFLKRREWLRTLPGSYFEQVRAMISDFWRLGIVEEKPGAPDIGLPEVMYVETEVEPLLLSHKAKLMAGLEVAEEAEEVAEDKPTNALLDKIAKKAKAELPFVEKARRPFKRRDRT